MLTVAHAGRYLQEYVRRYRREYERFTSPPPDGGGYPRIPVSPYLYADRLECHLAADGAVVLDTARVPPYAWQVAGGPAIMTDLPNTRTPNWVTRTLEREGLAGETIGIARVVSQSTIPEEVWRGQLGTPVDSCTRQDQEVKLEVFRYSYGWSELIQRLTFGALELVLDLHLPSVGSDFWNPKIVRNIGFLPADRNNSRFFHYAELLRHTDEAAWDERSIWVRAHVDLRRDFAHSVTAGGAQGGTLSLGSEPPIGPHFFDRLDALRAAADGLERLLDKDGASPEEVFHYYIRDHPVLLDVYGYAVSKPRLTYPEGEGPTGKSFVEPDFILSYRNETYKLVELERPAHSIATREGHPRVAVTHAAYQIAEWKDFIYRHYDTIKARFPGIAGSCSSMVVVSRDTQASFGGATNRHRYMAILRQQLGVDEVVTYDGLVDRAREAVTQLQSLASALTGYPGKAGTL